jgi:dihydrolipoamide dehydrogenase
MPPKSLIVIGAGPGGYAAALEAARRGLTVTLIDTEEMGGTCLNRGCVPSKFFLAQAKHAGGNRSVSHLMEQKNTILSTLRQRMEQASRSASVTWVQGTARLVSTHQVEVSGPGGVSQYQADFIILATGSSPIKPALFPVHPAILDSTSLLSIDRIPKHLVVVGGGYIGCELACAFNGLGSKVTLIEKEASLLATQPEFKPAVPILKRSFEKQGITVRFSTEVLSCEIKDKQQIRLVCSNKETIESDAVLVAIGRTPNSSSLNLESAGITIERGRPVVDDNLRTSVPHIYAIGDLVGRLPLAHTATKEAEVAIAHIVGDDLLTTYDLMPRCIYTFPEAAAVGRTEYQVQSLRTIRYFFAGNARAMTEDETDGFWAISVDKDVDRIQGGLIVGPQATELIHLIELAVYAKFTRADIARMVFAHPTLAEGFREAMARSLAPVAVR